MTLMDGRGSVTDAVRADTFVGWTYGAGIVTAVAWLITSIVWHRQTTRALGLRDLEGTERRRRYRTLLQSNPEAWRAYSWWSRSASVCFIAGFTLRFVLATNASGSLRLLERANQRGALINAVEAVLLAATAVLGCAPSTRSVRPRSSKSARMPAPRATLQRTPSSTGWARPEAESA